MIEFYKHTDTLGYLVTANKLTYEDYANPKRDKNGNLMLRLLYWANLGYTTADFP